MQVSIAASLQLAGHSLTLPLTVTRLQFHAMLRVSAQPLLPSYPFLGALGITLLEPPHIDFELPVAALGGLDLMALPFVRGTFRHAVRLAARQYVVFPK